MYIIDTNVASELIGHSRVQEPNVVSWFGAQRMGDMYLTAVNQAELMYGIALMPIGKRSSSLQSATERWLASGFLERILPFDDDASLVYAQIAATRRLSGQPIGTADCQIAAITRVRNAVLVTRNVRDFEGTGIEIVNPWIAS